MGKIAGQNMAGRTTPYTHLPFFYSDLFELGYEAVGELDSRLEAVADWKTPFREGVVYYLQAGRGTGGGFLENPGPGGPAPPAPPPPPPVPPPPPHGPPPP